ncbi:MAG TPA: nuclear transport factor 2 family protein, partial [Chitinophagaceae bacterium]|nr:nuclear transport factor 2 family protein [Chitinophagaceae bacterium]
MKLTKKLEAEIRNLYEVYWNSYINGDLETYASLLDEEFKFIGSTEAEPLLNKKDSLKLLDAVKEQMAGKAEFRNRNIKVELVDELIVVSELCDGYILIGTEWNFYSRFRLSSLLKKKRNTWKFIHQHVSMPDSKAQEGEAYGLEQIRTENIQLRDAVKRRTVELENKNRELEIETALERVRAVAMSMRKPEDLSAVGEIVFKELKGLGFADLRNTEIIIINDSKETLTSYYYSDYGVTGVVEVLYKTNPTVKKWVKDLKKANDAFAEVVIHEKEMAAWRKYREEVGHKPDPKLNKAKEAYYYSYSIGSGGLSISTFKPANAEQIKILERFRNVFNLSYQRYIDIAQAEAQAREAQIQLALERVRARTMAMHHSDELTEVVKLLYQEFDKLKINNESTDIEIGLIDEETGIASVWAHFYLSDGTIATFKFPFTLFEEINSEFQQWKTTPVEKRNELFLTTEFSAEQWDRFMRIAGELPELAEIFRPLMEAKIKKWVTHNAYFSHGLLTLQGTEAYSPETQEIQKRFAKVFEQTYTRFLDLQKAEAQARDAKIETALEKVRSRSMGMQKSDELAEVVAVLYKQFEELDFGLYQVLVSIYDKKNNLIEWWSRGFGDVELPQRNIIPIIDHSFCNDLFEKWENGVEYYPHVLEGKTKKSWDEYLFTKTDLKNFPEEVKDTMKSIEMVYLSDVFMKYGSLQAAGATPLPDDKAAILRRFVKVLDLAYTRMKDLQTAEAQAREAQIELGLERVRARAMAMQKSDELSELVDTVFKELTKLDFALTWCIINIIDESSMSNTVWAANPDINKAPESYHMLFEDYPFHHAMMKGWKERRTKDVYVLEGAEKKVYDEYLFNETEFRRVPAPAQAASRAMEKYVVTFSFSNFGGLQTVGDVPLSDANLDILSRFGKVFDLTYTRFNDLKQAEEQARESQIQLALERVRARTMAMQKSDELPETSYLLFQQVKELGLTAVQNSIGIVNEEAGFVELSTTVQGHHLPHTLNVPIDDPYVMAKAVAAWKAKRTSLKLEFEGAELKDYNEHRNSFFETKVNFPEDQWIVNISFFSKGWLSFSSDKNISDETFELLKRFAAVFEQTYTRFSDLRQAEEQARESQIQLALERVRARTMAMQKSDELAEVVQVVFEQLQQINFNIDTASFSLNYKEYPFNVWMAAPNQPYPAKIEIPDADISIMKRIRQVIAEGLDFFATTFNYEEKNQWLNHVFEHTIIKYAAEERKNYMRNATGISISISLLKHIALTIGNYATIPYTEEENEILKRFTKVFEQTYTRFLDLQKAEAQAREAQIQLAMERVRARTMAMQKSNELPEAANLLFLQVQSLGMPAWSAGYCIWDDDKKAITLSMSSEGVLQPSLRMPLTEDPSLIHFLEAHQRGETFFVEEVGGEALKSHYVYLRTLPGVKETLDDIEKAGFPVPTFQIFHCAYFSKGFLLFITYEPVPDAHDIFKRFANVFEQTYTRFL